MGVPAQTCGCTEEGMAWTHAGKRRTQSRLNDNGERVDTSSNTRAV